MQKSNPHSRNNSMIQKPSKKRPHLSEKGLKRVAEREEQLAEALRKNLRRRRERKVPTDSN